MPQRIEQTPSHLKPFIFHGVKFVRYDSKQAHAAECPFCQRAEKFAVLIDTGQYKCVVCGESGNATTFLRKLWELSDEGMKLHPEVYRQMRADRFLLDQETLMHWGVVDSILTDNWLVPAFNADGNLCQLYKRIHDPKSGRWEMRPTPEVGHHLMGVQLHKPGCEFVHLHESWGNAMAWWETLRQSRLTNIGLEVAADGVGLTDAVSVLAVANCGAVGEPLKRYAKLFAGKDVTLFFDSDHPKTRNGREVRPAGFDAVKRAASILSAFDPPPRCISWLKWGEDGFDPNLKDGFDVRDALNLPMLKERQQAVQALLDKVVQVDDSWKRVVRGKGAKRDDLQPVECTSWKDLTEAWKKSGLRLRTEMWDVLAVMLATALSTERMGQDQIFLQVVAAPSMAKTTFSDAMLTAGKEYCAPLEHLTGFFSGYKEKGDKEGDKDFSAIVDLNNTCWITGEGDVIMSNLNAPQILAQVRRIFDGRSTQRWKHVKGDRNYVGMRTPWIMVGTPAMLRSDQNKLGDRFLRIWMQKPVDEEMDEIILAAGRQSARAVRQSANGTTMTSERARAYCMTGGYVRWLREHEEDLFDGLVVDEESVVDKCKMLAKFAADCRARRTVILKGHDQEHDDDTESPARICGQLVRLAHCLALVLSKNEIDSEVMRVVTKLAVDSGRGPVFNVVRLLLAEDSLQAGGVAHRLGRDDEATAKLLAFLKRIKVVESHKRKAGNMQSSVEWWSLTPRMRALAEEVLGDATTVRAEQT